MYWYRPIKCIFNAQKLISLSVIENAQVRWDDDELRKR